MDMISPFEQALLAEREGKYHEALQLFQICLEELEHDKGEIQFHCGWCAEQESNGDTDQALRYYELAAVDTSNPECRLNSFFRAGWLLMHRKEHAKAATMFRYAIDFAELSHHKNEAYNQSAFWYAFCLESQARYIEAIRWYRHVRLLSSQLDPECRIRELACLNQIGSYDEALSLCATFDAPPPGGFNIGRYDELRISVSGEQKMLRLCLSDRPSMVKAGGHYGSR
jgi:tetratricopeptide (TPR) repeat protein